MDLYWMRRIPQIPLLPNGAAPQSGCKKEKAKGSLIPRAAENDPHFRDSKIADESDE